MIPTYLPPGKVLRSFCPIYLSPGKVLQSFCPLVKFPHLSAQSQGAPSYLPPGEMPLAICPLTRGNSSFQVSGEIPLTICPLSRCSKLSAPCSNALGHLPLAMCSKLSAPCSNSPNHLPPGGISLIIFLYSKFWREISSALLKIFIGNEIVWYILKIVLNFQLWVCAFSNFPRNSLHRVSAVRKSQDLGHLSQDEG